MQAVTPGIHIFVKDILVQNLQVSSVRIIRTLEHCVNHMAGVSSLFVDIVGEDLQVSIVRNLVAKRSCDCFSIVIQRIERSAAVAGCQKAVPVNSHITRCIDLRIADPVCVIVIADRGQNQKLGGRIVL